MEVLFTLKTCFDLVFLKLGETCFNQFDRYVVPTHWFLASPLFFPFINAARKCGHVTTDTREVKMEESGHQESEMTRITVRFVSIRIACGIFRCYSNCSSFYAFKRVLSTQTSVFTAYEFSAAMQHKSCTCYVQKQKLCTPFSCFFVIPVHLFPVIGKSTT